jgi:hypothetical protein
MASANMQTSSLVVEFLIPELGNVGFYYNDELEKANLAELNYENKK